VGNQREVGKLRELELLVEGNLVIDESTVNFSCWMKIIIPDFVILGCLWQQVEHCSLEVMAVMFCLTAAESEGSDQLLDHLVGLVNSEGQGLHLLSGRIREELAHLLLLPNVSEIVAGDKSLPKWWMFWVERQQTLEVTDKSSGGRSKTLTVALDAATSALTCLLEALQS